MSLRRLALLALLAAGCGAAPLDAPTPSASDAGADDALKVRNLIRYNVPTPPLHDRGIGGSP